MFLCWKNRIRILLAFCLISRVFFRHLSCGLPPAPSHFHLIRFRYYKVEFVIFQSRFAHAQMRLRSSARGIHLCLRSSPLGSLFQPLS